jgi:hypothetical protein
VSHISTLPANVNPEQYVALVQEAFTDIASATTVRAVRFVLDQWAAWAEYARRVKDKQREADAREIRKRGERRIGEMLRDGQKDRASVGRPTKNGLSENPFPKPTLAELEIDKNLANNARKEAAKSKEQFEAGLADERADILNSKCKPKTIVTNNAVDAAGNGKIPRFRKHFNHSITYVSGGDRPTQITIIIPTPNPDAPPLLALEEAWTVLGNFIQHTKDETVPGAEDAETSAAKRKADYATIEVRQ